MKVGDSYDDVFDKFMIERQHSVQSLHNRFRGVFRAWVVETNDPLNLRRVRVRVPELHDSTLPIEKCPWAAPAPWMGGSQCGSWTAPIKNDIVFILMEKNHPYSLLWWAGADATRRARYALDSVYNKSPANFTIDQELFEAEDKVKDYLKWWLPHDYRPMSQGFKDRYGHCLILNAVGYFPIDHKEKSVDPGYDPVGMRDVKFDGTGAPEKNNPDCKYVALYSKYGNFMVLSDVGYDWEPEFTGDWDNANKEERKWERSRAKYFLRMHTEQCEQKRDERRLELRTRYGHLVEMRDVGWNKARPDEYGKAQNIANSKIRELVDKLPTEDDERPDNDKVKYDDSEADQRWIKMRTKGGHLIQMMDFGMDPENDNFVKQLDKNEFGGRVDEEELADWNGLHSDAFWSKRYRKDARFIRLMTRYGYRIALDDRGTDKTAAEKNASPVGNGIIMRGRRKCGDTELGFGLEFNEKDKLQHIMAYTPQSKTMEMNDKWDYNIFCTDIHGSPEGYKDQTKNYDYSIQEKHEHRRDNEFSIRFAMCRKYQDVKTENVTVQGKQFLKWVDDAPKEQDFDPELRTHHLKLDKRNVYIRLKTHRPVGGVVGAGMESRCPGGQGGNWTEVNDHQDRGLWMVNDAPGSPAINKVLVLRSPVPGTTGAGEPRMWMSFYEEGKGGPGPDHIYIHNNGDLLQIFCDKQIQVISKSDNIHLDAKKDITLRARTGKILLHAQRVVSVKSDADAIRMQASNEVSIKSDGSRVVLQGSGPWWQVGPGDVGTASTVNASRYNGIFSSGDKYVMPGPAVQDSGNASSYGSAASPAEPAPQFEEKHLPRYKPTGESAAQDSQRMKPDTSERACDKNCDGYKSDFVQRTKDIWND